jgi:tRNA modification GTPase
MSEDTICALATASGGAIGVIRVSGPQTLTLADKVFRSRSGKTIATSPTHRVLYGEVVDDEGHIIDDVLASVFRGPHSYTGEDSVEFSCHGSRFVLRRILETLISNGCRQAEPGEYTQRAFLNGKMDLSQAEAVADLIASTNRATHRMAMSQLRGRFSSALGELRDQLLHLTSLLELELDFSDHEDLEFADRSELRHLSTEVSEHIGRLIGSFRAGKAMKEGVPVAIIGKTNVGKSTLLNRLLHDDKAIVSDIHGTTRDVIEDTTVIRGVCFRFIDTAGLRDTTDTIERMGIDRSYEKLSEATIVLWLFDTPPTLSEREEMEMRCAGKALLPVFNKVDRGENVALWDGVLSISAKYGQGMDLLEERIYTLADLPEVSENDVIVTNARHYSALKAAQDDMRRVCEGMDMGLSGDLLSEDLRSCIHHLSEIVGGEITPDETLSTIFKEFCVGK